MDLIERLRRWADSDDDTLMGKRKPDPTSLKRQAAALIETQAAELRTLRAERDAARMAMDLFMNDPLLPPEILQRVQIQMSRNAP